MEWVAGMTTHASEDLVTGVKIAADALKEGAVRCFGFFLTKYVGSVCPILLEALLESIEIFDVGFRGTLERRNVRQESRVVTVEEVEWGEVGVNEGCVVNGDFDEIQHIQPIAIFVGGGAKDLLYCLIHALGLAVGLWMEGRGMSKSDVEAIAKVLPET